MKIYTRTGDDGETSLFDGTRVSKSDPRVAAYGDVDEISAVLGIARTHLRDRDVVNILDAIQRDLLALGARLADPRAKIAKRVTKVELGDVDVERLEAWIDQFTADLPPLRSFIVAGGAQAGANLHLARAICRRAERRVVALGPEAVEAPLLTYLNRLSDLLFVLARVANHREGMAEVEW